MAKFTGTSGNNIIYGTSGADYIDGKGSRDFLFGRGGNDTIVGGLGNDIMEGGSGFDTFFFGHLHDADRIRDFSPGDTIDLGEGIDHYFMTLEEGTNWVRIATVDWDYKADLVQGSIVLEGVTLAEWTSWKGAFGDPNGYSVSGYSSGSLIV